MTRGPYKSKPIPGTVADLVIRYRKSPRVLGWAPGTVRRFDPILSRFMASNARIMVTDIRRGDIIAARDEMAATPGEANNWMKVISGLLDYAADIEMIDHNPARGIKRLKLSREGFRSWREDEIAAFEANWPSGSLPRLVFTLALYTGAARGDLVGLGPANIRAEHMVYRRRKTGTEVCLPILPPLRQELAQVPHTRLTFLQTAQGLPRPALNLATVFRRWVEAAGLGGKVDGHHLSLHGLRKALGRRLADAGCTETEIAAVLGHTDMKQVQVYTRGKDMAQAAERAAEKLGAARPQSNVTRIRRND